MARQSLQALLDAGWLGRYCTTLGWTSSQIQKIPLPRRLQAALLRRSYAIPAERLYVQGWLREAVRLMSQQLNLTCLTAHERGWACIDAVFQAHDAAVSRYMAAHADLFTSVYGYEDSCAETFKVARQLGMRCVYELPIAYYAYAQQLLHAEALRYPEWEPSLIGNRDSAAKNERKAAELALADVVLCPSQFVLRSLPLAQQPLGRLVPYGSPIHTLPRVGQPRNVSSPLRILFAGSLTQRKGLADVFAAMRLLQTTHIQLVLVGAPILPLSFYRSQYPNFEYHPPCSNAEMLRIMQSCDVLCLPSIVEGRAIVQLEALACGLPLIITPNTGGEDLVVEGQTGYVVPIGSPEAIAKKITWFGEHRSTLEAMRVHCRQKALESSWETFRQRLVGVLSAV